MARPQSRSPWILLLSLILSILASPMMVRGQDAESDATGEVFAPFASRLRISIRDPQVRLTWVDADDVAGPYRIYRHTEQITARTFPEALLVATVEAGTQSYIDAPPEPGAYHYAIVAVAGDGSPYAIFVPYRNTTFSAVTVEDVATVEERAVRVTGIEVFAERSTIIISYGSDQAGRELVIYRSPAPFEGAQSIDSAGVVATVTSAVESVVDYPVPGVPYYYAVADAALVAEGAVEFQPGVNATALPVEVPLTLARAGGTAASESSAPQAAAPDTTGTGPEPAGDAATAATGRSESAPDDQPPGRSGETSPFVPQISQRRPLPLPFLQLTTDLETGGRLGDTLITVPASRPLSPETAAAMDSVLERLGPSRRRAPAPTVLPDDALPAPRGAEFTLRTILDGPFARLAWEDAIIQLNNFLTLPLDDQLRSRAIFYRAQCYYFTGDTRRALVELLLARDDYFTDVEAWLDMILTHPAGVSS